MMRIAFFNWRDIRHPYAGGAEVYVHQVMKRFAEKGHRVTLFSSAFPGCKTKETIDNIEHIRYGGKFSIYLKSYFCYKKSIEGSYDIIVESINGMPFLTPLFAKEKTIAFVHQLTRENWYSALPFPIAFMGYHLEDLLLGPYKKCHAIGSSDSTRLDLERIGFSKVHSINPGNDMKRASVEKENNPTIIYLGRLIKSKNINHAIIAFKKIKERFGNAKLWIVGSGPEENSLRSLSRHLGLENDIIFFGHVNEDKKAELLSRSHLMLFPGTREGWGITVIEASACGTPVIGYDVPGLRDSIRPGTNGALVKYGDFNAMAGSAISLLSNKDSLRKLSESSVKHSAQFTWDRTAESFLSVIEEAVK
ncbi:MAG: glycosyltransferase family 4 protein [Candidatus Micrarchaeota archaeon]|nr:glycosyltransferase family 4 protein [Candidatus Micrarchaeota archaeon]